MSRPVLALTALLPLLLVACGGDAPALDVTSQAKGCFAVQDGRDWLQATADGQAFAFTADDVADAAHFYFQPSDLGTYLLYDADGHYLAAEEGPLTREAALASDLSRIEDGYISGGEWLLETSPDGDGAFQLRSRRHGLLLSPEGLTDIDRKVSALQLTPAEGCREHPELSLDATGTVTRTTFDDGDLYGKARDNKEMGPDLRYYLNFGRFQW